MHRFNDPIEDEQEKLPRVAVREQLLDLLAGQPTVMSSGGQVHIYLDTPNGFNCFTVPLYSPDLRGWLTVRHLAKGNPAPSDAQIRQALRVREAQCLGGTTRDVRKPMNIRYAWDPRHVIPVPQTDENGHETRDYFNSYAEPAYVLSLDTRRGIHVAITPDRWTIHPSQTSFRFDPMAQPLPEPTPTVGDPHQALQPFRKLLRLDKSRYDATWQTLLDWTLTAMRAPKDASFGNYPILNLVGSEPCGKSVTAKLLTQLLDPTLTPIHSLPTTERRLHGIAANHHILTFDDTGKINPEKSRQLSRLASGITSQNKLMEGVLVRPIILATSEESETRHLTNKLVDVELPPIENPQPQDQIQEQFEQMRPQILGALLTLLVKTFNDRPPFLPNRRTKNQKIEQSVTDFLKKNGGAWQGTAAELCIHVAQTLICSPEAMGKAVNEMKSLIVTHPQRTNKTRPLHLQLKPEPQPEPAGAPELQPETIPPTVIPTTEPAEAPTPVVEAAEGHHS
jgi:hypothetical protein